MATSGTATDGTLHVRFGTGDEEALEGALETLDRGEIPDPQFEVVYHDPADLHRAIRPRNIELLRAIVQHDPESIRETARLVDRDVRQVHRNLTELESLHLLELVEEGQAKRPHVWYDAIDIDLPLHSPPVGEDEAEV